MTLEHILGSTQSFYICSRHSHNLLNVEYSTDDRVDTHFIHFCGLIGAINRDSILMILQ